MPATYRDAGVDIDAGNALIERIKPFARATARSGCVDDLGGFGALFDPKAAGYKDPLLVSATDGVGTKLKIAQEVGKHDTIGIDLVAMCVNDLVVQGAEPLFFLDYFATGRLSVDVAADVIKGIADGCKASNCALIGGETAEMPGMYGDGEYDLAGFTVGAVERDRLLPADVAEGDVILGLASSGVHSNGFSLVRHIMKEAGVSFKSPAPFAPGQTFADILLTPTKLYVASCIATLKAYPGAVHAFAHITGGGLPENLPRVLPKELGAEIDAGSWQMPDIFGWLKNTGDVPMNDLYRTFNCGIGMCVVVAKDQVTAVASHLESKGETVFRIGTIIRRGDSAVVIHE